MRGQSHWEGREGPGDGGYKGGTLRSASINEIRGPGGEVTLHMVPTYEDKPHTELLTAHVMENFDFPHSVTKMFKMPQSGLSG